MANHPRSEPPRILMIRAFRLAFADPCAWIISLAIGLALSIRW